jgi:hypothetical protein
MWSQTLSIFVTSVGFALCLCGSSVFHDGKERHQSSPRNPRQLNTLIDLYVIGAKNEGWMRIKAGKIIMAIIAMAFCFVGAASAQVVVDKTVAVVSDGTRKPQLITYSDLLWQLALQPGVPLDKPRSEDLNQALQTLINQRIFAIEAERLPRAAPTNKEIADKISETLGYFPTASAFETRLKQVGFESVKDEAFERLIAQRLSIEKYVDFRFASFVVVTSDEEARYYRDVFTPEFRRRSPGLLLPPLEEKRPEIRATLTTQKIAAAIERFLDEAKRRVQVEIISEL